MKNIDLYLGDCLDILPKLSDSSIHLIFCDLPYQITDSVWDSLIPFDFLWAQFKRLIIPTGVIIFTASQPFTSMVVMSNIVWFRHEYIFVKNAGSNFGCLKYAPFKEHESVLVFSPGKYTYNPIMEERATSGKSRVKTPVKYNTKTEVYCGGLNNEITVKRPELRVPSSVQKWNRERGLHPNQKPLDMARYFIQTYSNEGDVVLDPTMGCGTFILAAKQLNRSGIGIELDEKYFLTAKERIENG